MTPSPTPSHDPAHGPSRGHSHGHSHGHAHEHEFEPQLGLPERLPANETLLWQGSPDWRALAVRAFHLRKLAAYFGVLALLRAAFVLSDGGSAAVALLAGGWIASLGAMAMSGLALVAWLSARGAVYTLTDRRVVMRIGVVLTVTFNLPHRHIAAAGLTLHPDRTHGDLPLTLRAGDQIAWLQLWPHVRPWKVRHAQPMLRCIPDAPRVARLLAHAWSQATGVALDAAAGMPATPAQGPAASAPAPTTPRHGGAQTALAGH